MEELVVIDKHQIKASNIITNDLMDSFISYLDVKPKSIETYTKAIRQFFNYLNGENKDNVIIPRPTRKNIIEFRDYLIAGDIEKNIQPKKATTVQAYLIAVRLFFSWTEENNIYPNIAEHIKAPKIGEEHKKDYLTKEQVEHILTTIDRTTLQGKRDYALFTLMVTGGLRTIEVERANIEDLQPLGSNTVLYLQGKGRDAKTEYVKVPLEVKAIIDEYLKERNEKDLTAPLFISVSNNESNNNRLTRRGVSGIIKNILVKAGYNSTRLTAHSLRHTSATLSLLNGVDIREVSQFLRHHNLSTTMIYAHDLEAENNHCSNTIASVLFSK